MRNIGKDWVGKRYLQEVGGKVFGNMEDCDLKKWFVGLQIHLISCEARLMKIKTSQTPTLFGALCMQQF